MAQPKRDAQNALFAAIQSQAENNMKSALRATEKATLLRELAEAYRLTAGGALPEVTANRPRSGSQGESSRQSEPHDESSEQQSDEEETQQEERPRRRTARRRAAG